MNNPPRSPSDGFRPTPIIVRRADGKLWNAIGIALFALGLITIFVLWSQGCAESGLRKRIEALNAEADAALIAGDKDRADDLRDEAATLAESIPAAQREDDAKWSWGESIAVTLGTLVGGPAAGAVLGALGTARRNRRKGAVAVAEAIEAAKLARPDFARFFAEGDVHDTIKNAMPDEVRAWLKASGIGAKSTAMTANDDGGV